MDTSLLSSGEALLYGSYILRRGVFETKNSALLYSSADAKIVFDGSCLYPLGAIEKGISIQNVNVTGALGLAKNILSLPPRPGAKNMQKTYAELAKTDFLKGSSVRHEYLNFLRVSKKEEYAAYYEMVQDFLEEESGVRERHASYGGQPESVQNLKVFLLQKNGFYLGMISSKYQSEDNAMINMLYVRPSFRGEGYGRVLLESYIGYLFSTGLEKVSLFFSPENVGAKKLYTSLGFEPKEEWIMATFPQRF